MMSNFFDMNNSTQPLSPSTIVPQPASPAPSTHYNGRRFPRTYIYLSTIILAIFIYNIPIASSFTSSNTCPPSSSFRQRYSYTTSSTASSPQPITNNNHADRQRQNSLRVATINYSPSNEMSDFQRRMRKLVQRDNKKAERSGKPAGSPPNFHVVRTLEEYKRVVGDEEEKIVAVRFYAPWCKACKAIAPSFYRLASTYSNVIFVDVPVTQENTNLHQGLGVPSLPFGHIYHPYGGLVEEKRISRRYFSSFAKSLKSYIDGQCDLESAPADDASSDRNLNKDLDSKNDGEQREIRSIS